MESLRDLVLARDYRAIPLVTGAAANDLAEVERLAGHDAPGVRELAVHCLVRSAAQTERLLELLADPVVSIRYAALRGLGARLSPELGGVLFELSSRQSEVGVRRELLVLAAESGLTLQAAALERTAEVEADPVARAACWVLAGRSGSARARAAVGQAHRGLDPRELARLLARPGWLEDPWCRETLRGLLGDPTPAVWIHSELQPAGPPSRRICDFAADRARALLSRSGHAQTPREVVYGDGAREALSTALAALGG